jgi:hypothetical protein
MPYKKAKNHKVKKSELDNQTQFRERRLKDIPIAKLDHPRPIPGYKSTLPGAPGNWAKEDPGSGNLINRPKK